MSIEPAPSALTRSDWIRTVGAAVVLALVCAAVVWWLEGFQRERLIRDFRAQLASLPQAPGTEIDWASYRIAKPPEEETTAE